MTFVSSADYGSVEIASSERVLYSPNPDFCGTDTFTYTALEQHAWYDRAIVFVNVLCEGNDSPVVVADSAETSSGEPVLIDVLANDLDPNGDALTITSVTQPAHPVLTVSTDGSSILYAPPKAWTGRALFAYTANDGEGGTGAGLVHVTVSAKKHNE